MKTRTILLSSLLCSVLSSAAAFAVPLRPATPRPEPAAGPGLGPAVDDAGKSLSRFSAGKASLTLDARLGHASVASGKKAETFLFAQISSVEKAVGKKSTPINLGIVIDRSGSMNGARIANAIAGAVEAVEKARDGDVVSVVSFDDTAKVEVAPTVISAETRGPVERSIRAIRLGGSTCISCGLETSLLTMLRAREGDASVNRMVLLSDGAANIGVRDVPGLRAIAGRFRDKGVPISTVGVDLDFDEKVMTAIANESNGKHHFVANASGLPAVFAQEFDSAVASVAKDAELSVELADDVVVEEVFDRPFRRVGNKVVVPFGTFGERQEKTVLMRLRVPATHVGPVEVGDVKLAYRDLVDPIGGDCSGHLGLVVKNDGTEQKELDPFVQNRVERNRTAKTLATANDLFEQGKKDEALQIIAARKAAVDRAVAAAPPPSVLAPMRPKGSFRDLNDDFDQQRESLGAASQGFSAAPSAESAIGRAERKKNASKVSGSMD